MERYDLDINSPYQPNAKKKGSGCAFAGWIVFLVVFAFVAFVGYRTWFFYGQLRSGEIVDLPQYGDRLTVVSGNTVVGNETVDREEVEHAKAPAFGASKETAELTIVQFADFQCPYSKDESAVTRRLMQKYGDRVRFEYRDYPIGEIHPDAMQASIAARCAQEQGKFWAYHDKLYNSSPVLAFKELKEMAVQTGLDPVQFERCLLDGRYRDEVATDLAKAQELGLRGTPTFFFDGKRVDGAIPEDVFDDIIDKMLE